MRKTLWALAMLAVLEAPLMAQLDTLKVLIWDNDAGEPAQYDPGCLITSANATYFCWTDWRYQHAEIEGQRYSGSFAAIDTNFLVNDNISDGKTQANTVIGGTDSGSTFVAWEEDSTTSLHAIYGRRFNSLCQPLSSQNVMISKSPAFTAVTPAIAVDHATGRAVVAWSQQTAAGLRIFARVWTGTAWLDTVRVSDTSVTCLQRNPAVAIHDTFIVVTWEDNRRGGGDYDIYARLFNNALAPRGANLFVNNVSPDSLLDQLRPTVALSDTTDSTNCYFTIAWEDYHYGGGYISDIRFKQYKAVGTPSNIQSVNITTSTPNRRPRVAMGGRTKLFITAWADSTADVGKYEIKVRMYDNYGFRGAIRRANSDTAGNQGTPTINFNGTYAAVAWLDSSRAGGRGDIFCQWFRSVHYTTGPNADNDSLVASGNNQKINAGDKLRANGRSVYYHFPNYDNGGTSGWNENPRPTGAPDSVLVPLDSAYARPLLARNITPVQSFVKVTDTDTLLAFTGQKLNGVADYDLCVMDLGYTEGALSSGTIEAAQQDTLQTFSAGGGALLCSGNDFGEYYHGTTLFDLFGAVYDGPGNAAATGNIDSLVGMGDAFTKNMGFDYPFQQAEDNSVDIIHAGAYGDTIFISGGPAKFIYCRATSYSRSYKAPVWHKNVYLPFAMGALTSSGKHPSTTTELTRRILAFQNFNVEPEPVADLALDTTTSTAEGAITLNWAAVSDDTLTEACRRYQVKFRRFDSSPSDANKLTSEKAYSDSAEEYYQAWTPGAPGANESRTLSLAPGQYYIVTVKAGDESSPVRWGALGSEPMIKARGDTLTPHAVPLGNACGQVRHFCTSEQIQNAGGDTLWTTWDAANVYFGLKVADWRSGGDLFIYMDTKVGGADSTIGNWNGETADTAALFDT
ncbi:MAG TPA: hypothetical protein VMF29_07875, partial [Candidatus Edwardsbacteria bacterium]|nr:hypothetical protein [Candidatus Edwardsbacteria bacterium]